MPEDLPGRTNVEGDLPPHSRSVMRTNVEGDLPPQHRSVMLYAAGGGFLGALLAIVVAKILAGPCCCVAPGEEAAWGVHPAGDTPVLPG